MTRVRSARPPSRQGLKVAAAVAVPVLVAAGLIALVTLGSDDGGGAPAAGSSSTTVATQSAAAKSFTTRVDDAFRPLGEAVQAFLPRAQEFEAGKVSAADLKGDVERAEGEFVKSRDAVALVPRYKQGPAANRYFNDAAALYVEVARIYAVAVDPAAEAQRAALIGTAKRLRILADRIYDRGRVIVDPGFYAVLGAEVEVRPPAEVPDWKAEGLSAGPPLAPDPGPAASPPPIRERTCAAGVPPPCRGEEPEKRWRARFRGAGFPAPTDVAAALAAADGARLGQLAADYQDRTGAFRTGPDPTGTREEAAVAALGLLTDAEGARIGQVATLLPAGALRERLIVIAKGTLVAGDDLLDPALGLKRSGLPESLLRS